MVVQQNEKKPRVIDKFLNFFGKDIFPFGSREKYKEDQCQRILRCSRIERMTVSDLLRNITIITGCFRLLKKCYYYHRTDRIFFSLVYYVT